MSEAITNKLNDALEHHELACTAVLVASDDPETTDDTIELLDAQGKKLTPYMTVGPSYLSVDRTILDEAGEISAFSQHGMFERDEVYPAIDRLLDVLRRFVFTSAPLPSTPGAPTDLDHRALAEWALGPNTGASSICLARHMMGLPNDGSFPRDIGDFNRCEALLKAVPGLRNRLPEMAGINKYWASLAKNWETIRGAKAPAEAFADAIFDANATRNGFEELSDPGTPHP